MPVAHSEPQLRRAEIFVHELIVGAQLMGIGMTAWKSVLYIQGWTGKFLPNKIIKYKNVHSFKEALEWLLEKGI